MTTINDGRMGGYTVGGAPSSEAYQIWDILSDKNIKSFLDVGCGAGNAVKYMLDKNIDAYGIDGSTTVLDITNVPKERISIVDYESSEFVPDKTYDVIWSVEFVEHVEEAYCENFLKTFDKGNKLIMTHAVPGQGGHHHVNEQNAQYWIEKLESRGFKYDNDETQYLKGLVVVSPEIIKMYEGRYDSDYVKKDYGLHIKESLLVFNKS